MIQHHSASRILSIAAALGVVAVLGASLAARIWARSAEPPRTAFGAPPPSASVPPPRPIVLAELPTPFCWGCSWNESAALDFQLDLDLLAPLGDGPANAALWFEQFAQQSTTRSAEEFNAYKRRLVEISIDGQPWRVLPAADPLLLAAEPWVDQASLSFYPDVWGLRGWETNVPNLLLMLDLARSWTARGKLSDDPDAARADFRRAIRLGRLLRQDDATLIQDLVAIACIRIGAEAMYEQARGEGDAATMVVTSLVLADKDAMRQMTARRITVLERALRLADPADPKPRLTDAELDEMLELTREVPERRFRLEGLLGMQVLAQLGEPEQRERARSVLEEMAGSADELTAQMAAYLRDTDLDERKLRELWGSPR